MQQGLDIPYVGTSIMQPQLSSEVVYGSRNALVFALFFFRQKKRQVRGGTGGKKERVKWAHLPRLVGKKSRSHIDAFLSKVR